MSKKLLSIIALLLAFSTNAQQTLNKKQMLEDFDLAVQQINTFAVHQDLNAQRLGINYEKAYADLRKQITGKTTKCEFKAVLDKVINLVQDQHCSFMSYDYLNDYAQYQTKLNFDNDQTFEAVESYQQECSVEPAKLNLPIMYEHGKYLFYADFNYKNSLVKRGTEILQYNGKKISSFIKDNYSTVWPVKWNQQLLQPYHTKFYQFGEQDFQLTLQSGQTISFNIQDSVEYLKKKQRDVYYNSQTKEQVLYFEQSNILYIGLPMMDLAKAESIINQIDGYAAGDQSIDKIVIDIRGNPGGNDMTWRVIVSHLLATTFKLQFNLKLKYNEQTVDFYRDNQEVLPQDIKLLGGTTYWTKQSGVLESELDKTSIDYKGLIYILQDEYIYSSAGNLSNFSFTNDTLISVGSTTDYVGGAQMEPLFYKLKNSQLVFRVEPVLDFLNVKNLADFSHNDVDVKISPDFEDYYLRTTYEGDLYSKEFLVKHDRLFNYVIEQAN